MTENTKKSTALHAVALSAFVALAGCGKKEEPVASVAPIAQSGVQTFAYKSVQECVDGKVFTPEYCETGFREAKEAHVKLAPRYATKADCEADFGEGKCDVAPQAVAAAPATSGQTTIVHEHHNDSSFMPFFLGYMMGGGSGGTTHHYHSTPVYPASNGNYRTLNGANVSRNAFTSAGSRASDYSFARPSEAKTYKPGNNAAAEYRASTVRPQADFKSSAPPAEVNRPIVGQKPSAPPANAYKAPSPSPSRNFSSPSRSFSSPSRSFGGGGFSR